jgi:hypothetical protein
MIEGMMKIVRNVLAVIVGLAVCMFVNGGIVAASSLVVPPPAGVDTSNMESLKANIHLFQPQHFLMPFLAHALGSLLGGLTAALIAASRKMAFALVIGVVHLIGGIAAATMIPAPAWFIALDLIVAYLPMAWLGGRIGRGAAATASATEVTA